MAWSNKSDMSLTARIGLTGPVLCGWSDAGFRTHPELSGRHCIREAGHEGFHIAQRDDETQEDTLRRCVTPEDISHDQSL